VRKLEISDMEVMSVAHRSGNPRNDESRYDHRLHGVCWWPWHERASGGAVAQRKRAHGAALGESLEKSWSPDCRPANEPGGRADDRQALRSWTRDLRRSRVNSGLAQNLWDGKAAGRALAPALSGGAGNASMSAAVRPDGIPAAQTPASHCQSRPGRAGSL